MVKSELCFLRIFLSPCFKRIQIGCIPLSRFQCPLLLCRQIPQQGIVPTFNIARKKFPAVGIPTPSISQRQLLSLSSMPRAKRLFYRQHPNARTSSDLAALGHLPRCGGEGYIRDHSPKAFPAAAGKGDRRTAVDEVPPQRRKCPRISQFSTPPPSQSARYSGQTPFPQTQGTGWRSGRFLQCRSPPARYPCHTCGASPYPRA